MMRLQSSSIPLVPFSSLALPARREKRSRASLGSTAACGGTVLDIQTLENTLTAQRNLHPTAVIIFAEPTERAAREFYRGDLDGLIDPRPPLRRVLVVFDGSAKATQLAEPR